MAKQLATPLIFENENYSQSRKASAVSAHPFPHPLAHHAQWSPEGKGTSGFTKADTDLLKHPDRQLTVSQPGQGWPSV